MTLGLLDAQRDGRPLHPGMCERMHHAPFSLADFVPGDLLPSILEILVCPDPPAEWERDLQSLREHPGFRRTLGELQSVEREFGVRPGGSLAGTGRCPRKS